jgi:5-methylcytosine-specific restriction endonuclease McrA
MNDQAWLDLYPAGVVDLARQYRVPLYQPCGFGPGRELRPRYWTAVEADLQRRARGPKPSKHRIIELRLAVFPRDEFTCQGCGWQPTLPLPPDWNGRWAPGGPSPEPRRAAELRLDPQRSLTLGHIVPATEGGDYATSNLRAECTFCNYGDANKIRAAHRRGLSADGRRPWSLEAALAARYPS